MAKGKGKKIQSNSFFLKETEYVPTSTIITEYI